MEENKNFIESFGEEVLRDSAKTALFAKHSPMLAPLGIAGAGIQALIGVGLMGVGKVVGKIVKD